MTRMLRDELATARDEHEQRITQYTPPEWRDDEDEDGEMEILDDEDMTFDPAEVTANCSSEKLWLND